MSSTHPETRELELDLARYQLRSGDRLLRLEKIPMELLILLAKRQGRLVSREEIVEQLWGKDVFLDTEQGINTAIRKIRQTIDDNPEQPRFLETVVGKGYRFVGPITIVGAEDLEDKDTVQPAEPVPANAQHASEPGQSEKKESAFFLRPRWQWLAAAVITAAVLAVCTLLWVRRHSTPSPQLDKVMLVVLPFENLGGDPAKEYFSDGLTEEMITQLGQLNPRQLGVIARTSAMRYKQTRKDVAEIGKELDVEYILEGSARCEENNVRVTAQLIQVKDRTHLWAHSYDGNLQDVLQLQREIATAVGSEIRIVFSQSGLALKPRRVDPEAYEAYLKGQFFWAQRSEEALKKALQYFQEAEDKDPGYAAAHASIALSYSMLEYRGFVSPQIAYPESLIATKRALDIDPSCPEAHLALAYIRNHNEWNWPEGEAEAKHAIELNPNYALAHQWYSYYLRETGRLKQAVDEMKQALQLDPASEPTNLAMAGRLITAHGYQEALLQLKNTQDLGFRSPGLYLMRADAHEHLKHQEQAAQDYAEYLAVLGDQELQQLFQRSLRAQGYERARGILDRIESQRHLSELQERARKGNYVSPADFAIAYASLGDSERAYTWLERAYTERSSLMIELSFQPAFDKMRAESRFQDLLKRVGVPQSQEQ